MRIKSNSSFEPVVDRSHQYTFVFEINAEGEWSFVGRKP
jgi:hypothetical protein